ncbi:MAG: NAD(P)H-dependent glycerol-3-phosphate dehydrogenase [Variovorax sp.]
MKIAVFGAGAWGTALTIAACKHHHVSLWMRDLEQARRLAEARTNQRYLPGIAIPSALALCGGDAAAFREAGVDASTDLVLVATPMSALRELLQELNDVRVPVVWLCKGIEAKQAQGAAHGLLGHEIAAQVAPSLASGVLSGPSFATEVAAGRPTALVAGSRHKAVRDLLVSAFHSPALRVYANDDVVGVEVGGAVKNVLAIATGLCDGLALGLNARAALVTRGLAEMTRFGVALGARAETFMGLSGLGDLVLTSTGDLSRNRKVGLLLAQGHTLAEAAGQLGHVAEGVLCARAVLERATERGVEMPITRCVVDLLDGRLDPRQAVAELMQREPGSEAS